MSELVIHARFLYPCFPPVNNAAKCDLSAQDQGYTDNHEVAAMASEMHSEPSHRSRSPIRCFPFRDDREFACRPVFLIVSLRPTGALGGEAGRFSAIESVQMSCSDETELNAV